MKTLTQTIQTKIQYISKKSLIKKQALILSMFEANKRDFLINANVGQLKMLLSILKHKLSIGFASAKDLKEVRTELNLLGCPLYRDGAAVFIVSGGEVYVFYGILMLRKI